jgi:hypothetical protein
MSGAINQSYDGGLPAALRLERAKDAPSLVSVFYGPVLLGAGQSKVLAKSAHSCNCYRTN